MCVCVCVVRTVLEKKNNFQNSDRGLEFLWKWKMAFI